MSLVLNFLGGIMIEEWKDIKGYEGLYQISNYGNVKSLNYNNTKKGKILKTFIMRTGYIGIGLNKNNKRKPFKIHRLVAEAFIPNPENLPVVNHKNEKKNDNRVENLEWCTYKYNSNYGSCKLKKIHKANKKVKQYTLDGKYIKTWESIKEASISYNLKGYSISYCCNGKRNHAGGYKWKYVK